MTAAQFEYGWNDPETARFYEAFCARHTRYAEANQALIDHAALEPDQRILDFAAGTGRTTETALPFIGDGRIDCVEPAAAMRAAGRARLTDRRVAWHDSLPVDGALYDRILCGAAIWQITPMKEIFHTLTGRLAANGAMVFDIPGLYLGQPDRPGGGTDPMLLALPAALAEEGQAAPTGQAAPVRDFEPPPDIETVDRWLEDSGLRALRWSVEVRLDQAMLRDWLKIPVLSNRLLPGLDADARARRIDAVWQRVDSASWRWERWCGWTASNGESGRA